MPARKQFRILDLGAHDGFVTNFIGRKFAEKDIKHLRIDGIEANPDAARIFNERAKRDGIPGKCKVGLAEDAPKLFMPGRYDAVVAFELIEHVPDVPGFLDVLEAMCKPDGRVYISTPDGTFGAGSNPHHLRVYRAVDLFDLLRRRGHVHDMAVGGDRISVAAYTPHQQPRREVAIYCGPGWEPWSPMDIEGKGLGGSETAAVRLAEALSELGCVVTVYAEVEQCAFKQIAFRHHSAFDPTDRRDIAIVSRIPEVFGRPINATYKVLWMHDTDAGERLTEELGNAMDRVFTLSAWHRDHFRKLYPFLAAKTIITRNGITPEYFKIPLPEDFPWKPNPHRLIYSSSPDRGLDLLLAAWPRIRKQVPDAELHYCYASVYDRVAEVDPRIGKFRDHIRSLAEGQEGLTNLGSLTQPQLAQVMRAAGVWVAPSYSTPAGVKFNETFCIGAVEAAAAGCVRVMASWGALEERDEHAETIWVGDDDEGKPDEDELVVAIIQAMLCAEDGIEPSKRALDMDWEEVACDFLAACPPIADAG